MPGGVGDSKNVLWMPYLMRSGSTFVGSGIWMSPCLKNDAGVPP